MAHARQPLTLRAVDYVTLQAPTLRRCIGNVHSQRLADYALSVRAAFGPLANASGAQLAMVVAEFARECITLPDSVASDGEDVGLDLDDVDDWSFGPAVAQAVAAGLAAVAGLVEPELMAEAGGISLDQAVELLLDLSRQLDSLAPHIFSGLCRAEANRQMEDDASDAALHSALQSICTWGLVAVGRIMGYSKLTASVLWDWGSQDALWVLVLAKGALTFSSHSNSMLPGLDDWTLPEDLEEMQLAVARAVLGLSLPAVAFSSEFDDAEKANTQDQVSMTQRAAQLACHRAQLAMTLAESQLLGPLLSICSGLSARERPLLASFLVSVLQPELGEDPGWAESSPFCSEALDSAREATMTLKLQLTWYAGELWAMLASVAAAGPMARTFIKDCAHLAFASLADDPRSIANVLRILRHGISSADQSPSTITALCMLAANARIVPSGVNQEDGGLAQALLSMHLDQRIEILGHIRAWQGATRRSSVLLWLQLIAEEAYSDAASIAEAKVAVDPEPAPPPQEQSAPKPAQVPGASAVGMRGLLHEAPPHLRCALDGRLVTDPVRAPSGYVFERAVLARALAESHGVCPVTGQPLDLRACPRDAELRRCAVAWIRDQRGARRASGAGMVS